MPSYGGPLAPWHVNTGPQEPRNDNLAKVREVGKVTSHALALKPCLTLIKTPGGIREWTSTQVTKEHLPRGSHNSFKFFGGSPEACNPMGVIKEVKIKSRQFWTDPDFPRNFPTILDRSRLILERSRFSQLFPDSSGPIRNNSGPVQNHSEPLFV